jgi:hypothetical protein
MSQVFVTELYGRTCSTYRVSVTVGISVLKYIGLLMNIKFSSKLCR